MTMTTTQEPNLDGESPGVVRGLRTKYEVTVNFTHGARLPYFGWRHPFPSSISGESLRLRSLDEVTEYMKRVKRHYDLSENGQMMHSVNDRHGDGIYTFRFYPNLQSWARVEDPFTTRYVHVRVRPRMVDEMAELSER